jgi:ferric-dicitrate binding protein FerR (iron transport regulator)
MSFEEFQQQARLYVVGALDEEETREFQRWRQQFGAEAEEFINECRKLNSVFALSLRPRPANPETKKNLLDKIRGGQQ